MWSAERSETAVNAEPDAHSELWGKTLNGGSTYPLLVHLLDTAVMARLLFDEWLRPGLQQILRVELGSDAREVTAFVLAMHDIGKANPIFQFQPDRSEDQWKTIRQVIREAGHFQPMEDRGGYKLSDRRTLRRHEQQSAMFIAKSKCIRSTKVHDLWQMIPALGHHGYFELPDSKLRRVYEEQQQAGWESAQNDLTSLVAGALGIDSNALPSSCSNVVTLLLSGLTILADRLASHDDWVESGSSQLSATPIKDVKSAKKWLAARGEVAKEHVAKHLGLYQDWKGDAESTILQGRQPREAQKLLSSSGGGMSVLMAPTGNGKTEAALLRHSQQCERLIFLLPTQATSNAIMARIHKAYENTANVANLVHGLASIEDFYNTEVEPFGDTEVGHDSGGLYPTEFLKKGLSRLLASVCVGTIDQALKAALPVKWVHLLLLALANSHIVIDEAHALDPYQTSLLQQLLPWLGATNTRVTLLTATFPSWQVNSLRKAYDPALETTEVTFPALISQDIVSTFEAQQYSIDFQVSLSRFDSIAQSHVDWLARSRLLWPDARLGIICNQIGRAQEVAKAAIDAGERVLVLHSAMTADHRRRNADELLSKLGPGGAAKGITVIGTQAIEASLDLDLDALSTDLCPSPSLLQRAGRVWRRPDCKREARIPGVRNLPIHVSKPITFEGGAHYPYSPVELLRTGRWLGEACQLSMPDDCQDFVDASTVSLNDLVHEGRLLNEEYELLIEHVAATSRKRMTAQTRKNSLTDLVEGKSRTSDFQWLTGTKETSLDATRDDLATRYIENETGRFIILGDPARIPGAWDGSVEELIAIDYKQVSKIRRAMLASIPLSEARARKLCPVSLSGSHSLLKYYQAIEVNDSYHLDLGLLQNLGDR